METALGDQVSAEGLAAIQEAASQAPPELQIVQAPTFDANTTRLGTIFSELGIPDDALVHLTVASPGELASGVNAGSIWVEAGEVSQFTLNEYRLEVIGPLSEGFQGNPTGFAVRMPSAQNDALFGYHFERNPVGVQEYAANAIISANTYIQIPRQPGLP